MPKIPLKPNQIYANCAYHDIYGIQVTNEIASKIKKILIKEFDSEEGRFVFLDTETQNTLTVELER